MSKQTLKMRYHPAKKEVLFTRRLENGNEIVIPQGSRLGKYMGMRGKFVLQDFGNGFFDDIVDAFDGLDSLTIEVVTTKLDYEDFVQMVEWYNPSSRCKLTPTLIAELPNMDVTYDRVKHHGEESIRILKGKSHEFYNIDMRTQSVRAAAESFVQQVDNEVAEIQEKIENLGDSNVSLCFTGVYSSGKSALINAILGYRILPEKIKSETAKMFVIRSPRRGEGVRVIFDIPGGHCVLEWDEKTKRLEFENGPSENEVRAQIQNTLNEVCTRPQHEQIYELLKQLNDNVLVSPAITVCFPIPLDNNKVQFTIYDTPGADSNYVEHKTVLADALAEQQQSILIFVAKPNALEGEGNNALLSYLKEAEAKSSKTSIDIGRSLFVINLADSVPADQRVILQTQRITNRDDDTVSIRLEDKKLFFTSALYAYTARAVKNGIAQATEMAYFQSVPYTMCNDDFPMSNCYKQNRCANSELATERMISACDAALSEARQRGEDGVSDQLIISSGLFALEREIKQYGEKFAAAVKAFAIIDSVDKALRKLSNSAESLSTANSQDKDAVENDIKQLQDTINGSIEAAYNKVSIPAGQKIPEDMRKALLLDEESLFSRVVSGTIGYLKRELKGWFLGLGKVKFKESDRKKVQNKASAVITNFTRDFVAAEKKQLEKVGTTFEDTIKKAIKDNGEISDAAKREFLQIPDVKVEPKINPKEFGEIYDANKRIDRVFIGKKQPILDKDEFLKDIELKLQEITSGMADDYEDEYARSLESVLAKVKHEFESKLGEYSLRMKALLEDKAAMIKLGEVIEQTAQELATSQEDLNRVIWEEHKND